MRTAEALASSQGNIAEAAPALHVHPNTIYHRITAARTSSGVDLRSPGVLADIQLIQASRSFGRYLA